MTVLSTVLSDTDAADLFSYSPPPGPRDGKTFVPTKDEKRLNRQAQAVWNLMLDPIWRTLAEVSLMTKEPEASVSARLRDFRKPAFGSHTVLRRRRSEGTHEYRVIPRAT